MGTLFDNNVKSIKFRDVLESVRKVNLFLSFSQRLAKFFTALAQVGVDVSKLNPYNFEDMVKMAASLRSQGVDVDFGDLDELMEEFNELMDMDINEMVKHANVIRKYANVVTTINSSVKAAARNMPKDSAELKAMMGMFGFNQPATPSTAVNEDLSDVETTELTEEDIKEFKEIINKFKNKK